MRTIELTKGYVALIDDEDFHLVSEYKWAVSVRKHTCYAVGYKSGKNVTMHRLVSRVNSISEIVDHKNRNGLDNRKCNLRVGTKSQNAANRSNKKGSSSKYLGVKKVRNSWAAGLTHNGKSIYLGCFNNETEAAKAYNRAAIVYHGEFANLNPI